MTSTLPRIRARPAHGEGPTFLAYTDNGNKLVTVGANDWVRVFETGSDGEPVTIGDCQENMLAVAATDDFFLTGAEDGSVCKYSLKTNDYDSILVRFSLPVRDVALSPDGRLAAVASDEIPVKVVDTTDTLRVFHLENHPKPAKHLSFDRSGTYLSVSCTDGVIYVYSFSTEQPKVVQQIHGTIRALEADAEASSEVAWHPDGKVMAVPTVTREIAVLSTSSGERVNGFLDGHLGDINTISWSPNGALLASAGQDGKISLWETSTQKIILRYDYTDVLKIIWHPAMNIASFTTKMGEVYIHKEFVPSSHADLLKEPVRSFVRREALGEVSGNAQRMPSGEGKSGQSRRRASIDSLDLESLIGTEGEDNDDFVVDDDGAGYALNGNGKRSHELVDGIEEHDAKRQQIWQPSIRKPFQSGSTPWRGNRKYLCLNLTGFVWTVDQETHHTVTVEFYDREFHRDFHFTDPYRYDKACLSENGTLFSCPSQGSDTAMIYYRPHETWTARSDWRTSLPEGEEVTAIALSDSFITVTTSADYVRVYTLFGTPYRVYRQKSSPTVTCAAWRDYVLTMGNGPVGADGRPKLVYSIENVRRDEICQNEDTVALAGSADIRSVFFSDQGDPCIYDSDGVLLVLQHWRATGHARWVPLLDTKLLQRLASGRKEETYWPVAVARDKFHCIILKGGDQYPYFPRPLLTEFDFKIPLGNKDRTPGEDETEPAGDGNRLEETFVRTSLMHSLLEDLLSSTHATHSQRTELARLEVEVDKTLLQLLNVECREGEDHGMKALEIVQLMRDRSGKMLDAAGKIAVRYGRTVLEEKIREVAEQRLLGEEDEV